MKHAMHTWSRIARRSFVMTCSLLVMVLIGLVGLSQEARAAVWFPVNDRPIAVPTPVQIDQVEMWWDIKDQGSAQMASRQTVLSLSIPLTDLVQDLTIPPHDLTAVAWSSVFGINQDARQWTFTLILQKPWRDGLLHLPVGAVSVASSSSVVPLAPAPSSVFLFIPLMIGLLSVLLREQQAKPLSGSDTDWMGNPQPSGSSPCLLVLSADPALVHDIQELVHRAGYLTRITADVTETLAINEQASPALLLVDRRVPDWDMLRTSSPLKCVPVITLAPAESRCPEEHWLSDLERGADGTYDWHDGGRLFLAKLRAYLRRAGQAVATRAVYQVGAVRLDADRREVTIAGQRLSLSAKPFAILKMLMEAPSRVFSRSELVDRVWGPQFAVGKHTLDVHVHALRRRLDRDPRRLCRLITIKGVGFKLKAADPMPASCAVAIAQRVDPLFTEHSALRKWSRL